MNERYNEYKAMIDSALGDYFSGFEDLPHAKLLESMRYSLMAGGKRIRPILVLEFCRAAGGAPEKALPAALAIEMLHTYSLIHDDLPCMDNDDLRRGEPTNHKVYGEWIATLAGDALQTEAYYAIISSELDGPTKLDCMEMILDAAGVDGICGGQYLDMSGEGKNLTEQELADIHTRKTASMMVTACCLGARIGGAPEALMEAAAQYGGALGMAFQVRDDMLDEIGSETELGKPIGSDRGENKTTYMTLLGEKGCRDMIEKMTDLATDSVKVFRDSVFLRELAESLTNRKN